MLRAALDGLGPAWTTARRRLSAWPHWVWPLALTAGLLAVGVIVLDDYAAIYYASMPYLWADPLGRFGELLATLSSHPTRFYEYFQGQYVYSSDLPALYLPVWIGITTPPWALLLAGLGAVSVCWRAVSAGGFTQYRTAL